MSREGLSILASENFQYVAEDLGQFLGTIMQLHRALAGNPLGGVGTLEGSLRSSDWAVPEHAAVNIAPGYKKKLQRLQIIGGMPLEASGDEETRFYTQRNWFEGATLFKARSTTSDKGELLGMQVEAIRPDGGSPDARSAQGVIIPGNELGLTGFTIAERTFEPVTADVFGAGGHSSD